MSLRKHVLDSPITVTRTEAEAIEYIVRPALHDTGPQVDIVVRWREPQDDGTWDIVTRSVPRDEVLAGWNGIEQAINRMIDAAAPPSST